MKPLLSCKEVSRLVSQGLDRRLGWLERTRLRLHLAICDGCTNFKKQMLFLRKALSRLAEQPKP
ncbi:MAG TPA: zf-HC2 domain-containing protein [Burkholderiales bacterium]|nr:zf-HC2 domain-containing protein [Burkholderiales bacterium]